MEGDCQACQDAAGLRARDKAPRSRSLKQSLGSHRNLSLWAQHPAHKADVSHPLANQKIGLN